MVGAGPSGATLGYYLGKLGRKVLLLEKKTFPRDKYCGDAVCRIAVQILHEMGLYEQLLRENKAYVVCSLLCFLAHHIVASYPGHVGGGKSGLVSTVCACAKNPMISWGIVYHRLRTVNLYRILAYSSEARPSQAYPANMAGTLTKRSSSLFVVLEREISH